MEVRARDVASVPPRKVPVRRRGLWIGLWAGGLFAGLMEGRKVVVRKS